MVAFTGSSVGSTCLQQLLWSLLQLPLVIAFSKTTASHKKQAVLLWSCCKVMKYVFCRKVVLANVSALDMDLGLSPLSGNQNLGFSFLQGCSVGVFFDSVEKLAGQISKNHNKSFLSRFVLRPNC